MESALGTIHFYEVGGGGWWDLGVGGGMRKRMAIERGASQKMREKGRGSG